MQMVAEWGALQLALTKDAGVLMMDCPADAIAAGRNVASVIEDAPAIIELLTADVAGAADAGISDLVTIPLTIYKIVSFLKDVGSAIDAVRKLVACMQSHAATDPDAKKAVDEVAGHIDRIVHLFQQLESLISRLKSLGIA
jgi:SpoU rRNA methylase family enzyme